MIQRLRRLMAFAALTVACCGAMAAPVFAGSQLFEDVCKGSARASATCQDGNKSNPSNPIFGRGSVLTKVVDILAFIIGVAAVIMLVVGGISYMLSSGDPGKINSSKNTIIYALIGVVVAVVARGIVALVLNKL